MFKNSLKLKLVAGALSLVLMVSLAITVVVSIIVNRQNRASVNINLNKAMQVVRHELKDREQQTVGDIQQMISAKKIGGSVKFLSEFADDELTITNSSYTSVATALQNQVEISQMKSIGIYNLEGRLQSFAVKEKQGDINFGFVHQGIAHTSHRKPGMVAANDEWKQTKDLSGLAIATGFGDQAPAKARIGFESIDRHLGMRLQAPLYGLDYDDDGNEILKIFGTLEAVKILDAPMAERLASLTGMPVNVFSGEQFSVGGKPAYQALESQSFENQAGESWSIGTQALRMGEVSIDDSLFFEVVLPIFGAKGYAGAVAILQSDAIVRANNRQMMTILGVVALACIVVMSPIAFVATSSLVRQVSNVVERLKDIAEGEGDLTKRLEVKSTDEIGQLATWFNAFTDNIHNIVREIKDNARQFNHSSKELSEIAGQMTSNSKHTSERTEIVTHDGNEMSGNIGLAAQAMEQAAERVQLIDTSTQEMKSTIDDISQNTGKARETTSQAVNQARSASQQVMELGSAAREIGNVINSITEISEQVNLLALNATIESARAGEAGKGFAVVANEIKELARQTAEATDEIKEKVNGIQVSTDGTIRQIDSVSEIVNNVNDIVTIIAGAVEEQSATTSTIAQNVSQAAQGIGKVNQNVAKSSSMASKIAEDMSDVTQAAGEISTSSGQVSQSASELSRLSQALSTMVDQFKV